MFLRYTRNPQEAARLGYVHPGDDRRIAGDLGRLLGRTQTELSFKSATPPAVRVERLRSGILIETQTWPNGRVHLAVAIPRRRGRWATFRAGWRWDPHWGDGRTLGYNPEPDIIGGAIADVIVKWNADQPFITEVV